MTKLLTVDEVAERTRLAKATIYKLAAQGEIPSQRMRRRLLFPADQLEAWIAAEGQTQPSPAPKND